MKRPWNLINVPVYSLATYKGSEVNMNICTYVSPISMQPKKYIVAVYQHTKSLLNILSSETAVLQLLHANQFGLVKVLGNKSGINFNKDHYLNKKELLEDWEGYRVLKNVSARLALRKESHQLVGDHMLFVFDVLKFKAYSEECLTLDVLREKKLIRI